MAEEMVMVRCVWPEARGEKPDCRNNTGIVWKGHGDVQPYPKSLWYKLAEHPDVWELVPEKGTLLTKDDAKLAKTKKDQDDASGKGTDLVRAILTESQLEEMTDEEVRKAAELRDLPLHPRLASKNLRPHFLAAQQEAAAPFPTAKARGKKAEDENGDGDDDGS